MNTQIVRTSLRQAFDAIIVRNSAGTDEGKRIAGLIHDKIHNPVQGPGVYKRNDWNANLTFNTYQKLKAEGVVA